MLRTVQKRKPGTVVIIGDFLDCYSVSQHSKDPSRKVLLQDEVNAAVRELDRLERLVGARVVFVEGNHETRLAREVSKHLPGAHGLLTARSLLEIDRRGWGWVPYGDWATIGKVAYTHDVGRHGANAARQSLLDFGGNLVFGHTHRLSVSYIGQTNGDKHVALNVGCGLDFDEVDYMHKARARRDWQHGFGWVDYDRHGNAWCQAIPIIDRAALVHGERVAA